MAKRPLMLVLSLPLLAGLWSFASRASLATIGRPPEDRASAVAHAGSRAQGRTLKKMKVVESTEVPDEVAALAADPPDRQACIDAAHEIAAAYGDNIESVLHEDFPNRAEFVDALQRAGQRVSNLELAVESIEDAGVQPWQLLGIEEREAEDAYILGSDCTVDVRMRLIFDGATSGQRFVNDVVSGEWRIRFTSEVVMPRRSGNG